MSDLRPVGAGAVDPAPRGTRVACIIGWPVEHSLSPAMHNAAFRATGLDWVYVPLPVPPEALAAAVEGMRALGIAGANVTMPHKQAVVEHLDDVSGEARRIGAVNVIVRAGDRLIGANTDGEGFLRFLEGSAGVRALGARVLLLGSGGAARSVAVALADAGAVVVIAARDPASAEQACAAAGGQSSFVSLENAPDAAAEATVIVNATPVGSDADELIIPAHALTEGHTVVDLIYAPPETPLLAASRARGARAHNGIGMLIDQAALAFELWTGTPAPVGVMSAAALAHMRESR